MVLSSGPHIVNDSLLHPITAQNFFLVTFHCGFPQENNLFHPNNHSNEQYFHDQALPKLLLHAQPS